MTKQTVILYGDMYDQDRRSGFFRLVNKISHTIVFIYDTQGTRHKCVNWVLTDQDFSNTF